MNRILSIFSCFFILFCSELIADIALKETLVLPMSEKEIIEWRVVRHGLTDKGCLICYTPTSELEWRCSKCLEIFCLPLSSFEPWATKTALVLIDHLVHSVSEHLGSELERTIVAANENEALIECYCPRTRNCVLYKLFLTRDWCHYALLSMVEELWQKDKERYLELINGAKLVSLQDPSLDSGLSVIPKREVPQAIRSFFPDFSCDHFAFSFDDCQSYIFLPKESVVETPEILSFELISVGPSSLQCVIDLHKLHWEQSVGSKLSFKTHFRSQSQALISTSKDNIMYIFKVFRLREGFAILSFVKESKKPVLQREMGVWLKKFKAVKLPSDW